MAQNEKIQAIVGLMVKGYDEVEKNEATFVANPNHSNPQNIEKGIKMHKH